MIGTSTRMTLLIDEGSMSICTFFDFGEKSVIRPVMRSSKRAPMFTIRSQPCIARLAS